MAEEVHKRQSIRQNLRGAGHCLLLRGRRSKRVKKEDREKSGGERTMPITGE